MYISNEGKGRGARRVFVLDEVSGIQYEGSKKQQSNNNKNNQFQVDTISNDYYIRENRRDGCADVQVAKFVLGDPSPVRGEVSFWRCIIQHVVLLGGLQITCGSCHPYIGTFYLVSHNET